VISVLYLFRLVCFLRASCFQCALCVKCVLCVICVLCVTCVVIDGFVQDGLFVYCFEFDE